MTARRIHTTGLEQKRTQTMQTAEKNLGLDVAVQKMETDTQAYSSESKRNWYSVKNSCGVTWAPSGVSCGIISLPDCTVNGEGYIS